MELSILEPSVISIVFSIISIGFGVEKSVGKFVALPDRFLLFLFATSDFLLRVVSIVIFVKQFPLAEWFLVPAIYLFECIIWYKFSNIGGTRYLSCIFSIPSVCTSGMALSFAVFEFRRKYFIHFFSIRLVLSSIISSIYLVVAGSILQTSLIVPCGIFIGWSFTHPETIRGRSCNIIA